MSKLTSSTSAAAKDRFQQRKKNDQSIQDEDNVSKSWLCPASFIRKTFRCHCEFCASQPWEVIVATLMFLMCFLTIANKWSLTEDSLEESKMKQKRMSSMTYTLVILAMSCLSILRVTRHVQKMYVIGSNLVWIIAVTYLCFTYIFFALVVWNLYRDDQIQNFWFMIPLFTDLSKVTRMTQFALCSAHCQRISTNVANGMYVLAPTFFLDTIAWTLFSTLGLITDIEEVAIFAKYTVVALFVNLFVYVIFYPAALSLVLQYMVRSDGKPNWDVKQIIYTLPKEESQSPNSKKVRVIVIAITSSLHVSSFFLNAKAEQEFSYNLEKIFFMICVIFATAYYLFNSDIDEAHEMRSAYIAELRELSKEKELSVSQDCNVQHLEDKGTKKMTINGMDYSSSESTWSEIGSLPDFKDQEVQTIDGLTSSEDEITCDVTSTKDKPRSLEECLWIMDANDFGINLLTDREVIQLTIAKHIRPQSLEQTLKNANRAVKIRRCIVESESGTSLAHLPYNGYNFERVQNACCENVIGYMPVPVGKVGPLYLDGRVFHVPMATTEGCLIASVNRGCRALREQGVNSVVFGDGMTRGPVVRFDDVISMMHCYEWLTVPENFNEIKQHFDSTSRFARLKELKCRPAGRELYIRFKALTGDAMGMNMLSKATEQALRHLKEIFPHMQVISLSGNFCTDKKAAAINWIDGRGKSVCCEAIVSEKIVSEILKTTPARLIDLNKAKNLVGSAQAVSIGGFNAQAANVVTAIFIATGQDAAQNVASSNCITQMETHGNDLYVTVTMPSIEVGTVGGGTILEAQANCLELLGVRGSHSTTPGENAKQLAKIVAATVLAGELSLMSALAEGHLVKSHLRHNRSVISMGAAANPESN